MNSKQVKELNNKWNLKLIKNIILYINSFFFSRSKIKYDYFLVLIYFVFSQRQNITFGFIKKVV